MCSFFLFSTRFLHKSSKSDKAGMRSKQSLLSLVVSIIKALNGLQQVN